MTADVLPPRNVAQGASDTADIVQVVIIVAARLPGESARSDDVERVGACMYGVYCTISRWSWFKLGNKEHEVVHAYSTLHFQLFFFTQICAQDNTNAVNNPMIFL